MSICVFEFAYLHCVVPFQNVKNSGTLMLDLPLSCQAPQNVAANCLATSSQAVANEQRPAHSVHSDDCGCRMDSQQGSIGLSDPSSNNEVRQCLIPSAFAPLSKPDTWSS